MIAFSKQKYRIILLLLLVGLLVKAYYSERILINDGQGWDGWIYGDFTKNIITYLKSNYINKYHFQRIGVPFILHFIFSACNIEFSNLNIVTAFSFLNICCILIGAIYFFLISTKLKLTQNEEIVGFASLFFCFPILKFSLFYPVLMDIPAFTMGIILVYYYLKRNIVMYFFMIFIGSFIYPTFIIMSLLFFFKENKTTILTIKKTKFSKSLKWKFITDKINIVQLLLCFSLPYLFIAQYYNGSLEFIIQDFKYHLLQTLLIWFSFFLALAYLIYLTNFSKSAFSIKKIFKSLNPIGVFLTVVVYIAIQLIINHFASNGATRLTLESYLYNIIAQAVQNPINFIVAHIFYFGLTPLLSFFILKDLKKEILNFGFGMISFFALFLFFSIGSESRQLINYYPFLVLLMLVALNKYWQVSLTFSIIYSLFCLALSHFWFTINNGLTLSTDYSILESYSKFPMQRYFMFQGPWVSGLMYKIHFGVCAFLFALILLTFKKTKLITRKSENL